MEAQFWLQWTRTTRCYIQVNWHCNRWWWLDFSKRDGTCNKLFAFQVVGGGGLVVSPIQLLASSQGFKVIGQPNGVTTIELSTPHSKLNQQGTMNCLLTFMISTVNGYPTGGIHHRTSHLTSHSQPGNLQKLLMNGVTSSSSANISTINIPSIAQLGSNGSRLAPGGAELNLIPSNSASNGNLYRNQGKLAMIKGKRIHSTPRTAV